MDADQEEAQGILSIAEDLRDDMYDRLVNDFLGSQTGEGLLLDEKPCKNRLLVQVGLLKEDNEVPWGSVLKWLQKIFPMFQSADFQCLIERNIETTLSLAGDAQHNFLETDVNFEFVGAICDSIGIGRTELLEMSDFSERAKGTEITNGLMLELNNFVQREKIDTIVLVSWLKNFDPNFCSDGKIQKAHRLLKTKLHTFMSNYRNFQRTRYRANGMKDQFLQTPFDLYGIEIPDAWEVEKPSPRRGGWRGGGRGARGGRWGKKPLGRPRNIKEEPDTPEISEKRAQYTIVRSGSKGKGKRGKTVTIKQEYDSDGYNEQEPDPVPASKSDPNVKDGESLTLLDVSIISVQKLSNVYGGKTEISKQVSLDLLKNQYTLMLAEDTGMNYMTEEINALSDSHNLVSPLDFLHYNTHYLLDIYDAIEQQIMSFEREIVISTGEQLGRDNNPTFKHFMNYEESATCRYIRMASDVLSPHEDAKNNCRRHWLAFCMERKNPSRLPANVSNRFNNYFEAAAALLHHRSDVMLFFSDLQALNDEPNITLDSINDDANDDAIQALLCVLAVIYCKILGPYWQLLKSKAQYALYSRYIYCLYQKLLLWSRDATTLMEPEIATNVFLQVPLQEGTFSKVFSFCSTNADNQYGILIRTCLEKVVKVIAAVTEENLKDFLPGGIYCQEPPPDISKQLKNCTFSHLMGEYPFGQAFPYKSQRPDQPPAPPPPEPRNEMLLGQKKRLPTLPSVRNVPSPVRGKKRPLMLPARVPQKEDFPEANDPVPNDTRESILRSIERNGGPCHTREDVDKLLVRLEGATHAQKREAVRCEIGYQKVVLGIQHNNLASVGFSLSDMVAKLKSVLPSEEGNTSQEEEDTEGSDDDGPQQGNAGHQADRQDEEEEEEEGDHGDRQLNLRREGLPLYQPYRAEFDTEFSFSYN
ncbi:solute carrier family 52, riboflavin transporter, member 2 isoform X1 [Engraulis encrasicolus]|uniref:solute carrier family 52, riboflavin transporter, member 2 isoform X1 n=1 Tax=Engraulis encrasicolus TaxID=184585 RepID=UPI002FD3D273